MCLWIYHFHLHLALLQGWLFSILQDNIFCQSSNSIFLIRGHRNVRWKRVIKFVSDQGSFLKRAVSICFSKSRQSSWGKLLLKGGWKLIHFLAKHFKKKSFRKTFWIFRTQGVNKFLWKMTVFSEFSPARRKSSIYFEKEMM